MIVAGDLELGDLRVFERALHHAVHRAPAEILSSAASSAGLHSTQIDSGTLCSSHQSATSAFSAPMSAENFGSDQPVWCPHTASAISPTTTPAVGTVRRSQGQ